jgi:hypothetical protein
MIGSTTSVSNTAERLRADINRGRTGDKVPFHDPAAAPLGTDDEAGGTPPSAERVAMARAHEIGGDSRNGPAVTDERTRGYNGEADDRVPGEAERVQASGAEVKTPTPWPGGKRRNMRAALMLGGAVILTAAVLSVWAALVA